MKLSRFPFLFLLFTIASGIRLAAQDYNPDIDVLHYDFHLQLNDTNNRIEGVAGIRLVFRKETPEFKLDLTGKNGTGKGMTVLSVREGRRVIPFRQEVDHLLLEAGGQPGDPHTYTILYEGIPTEGLVIANNKYGHRGFFGDNWPNRAHNWLPCVDDPSDKATVDWWVTAPAHYTVVANGSLQEETPAGNRKTTHWTESVPLSPKIMVIGVADFAVDHPGDAEGIPVWNYVYPENKEQGFHDYSYPLQILPFYISHIGPYPFEKCGNVQSKTQFGGLENASAIFYDEGSVGSPGVESLMAHEIAHQWFGDAATETAWRHLWLSEGFATYMTHCYLENKYGIDTLKKGMAADRTKVINFERKRQTPVIDSTIKEDYMQLLNPNSYQKGGWVLHMLRRRLGDDLFWKGISAYYVMYRNTNANSEDFEQVMETVSGQDLHPFFDQWLNKPGHPHIRIDWKYEPDKKLLRIYFTQTGETLFDFPLEYAVDGNIQRVDIREKITYVDLPVTEAPTRIIPDPNVNILAGFEIAKP